MATRFPWETEQSDPFGPASPFSASRTADPWQGLRSTGQNTSQPSTGLPQRPSSRQSGYNRLLDPNRGMLRGIGQLLGAPTEAEFQRQQFSGAQAAAATAIQQRIAKGMSPQKAILDFVQSDEGITAFNSGVDLADLANIGTLASGPSVKDQLDLQKAQLDIEQTQLENERLRNPTTEDITEFNKAKAGGYTGNFMDFLLETKRAGAQNIVFPNQEPELIKTLGVETGKRFAELQVQGDKAGAFQGDLEMMAELIKLAPQGPLIGRLQEAFPGIDSAGAAFQSIVKRITPQLRVPGSGATSDMEMKNFAESLPQLLNKPEANTFITAMLIAKAQLDIERSMVVDQIAAQEITPAEGRRRIAELNTRSLMTPEIRRMVEGLDTTPAKSVPGIPDSFAPSDPLREDMWRHLTPEERRLFQ